jgi:hypothetical protein
MNLGKGETPRVKIYVQLYEKAFALTLWRKKFNKIIWKNPNFSFMFTFPPSLVGQFFAMNDDYVVFNQFQFVIICWLIGELDAAQFTNCTNMEKYQNN